MPSLHEQLAKVRPTMSPTMTKNLLISAKWGVQLNRAQTDPLVHRGLLVSHGQQELTPLGHLYYREAEE